MPFETEWSTNIKSAIGQVCDRLAERFEGLRWERADDITEPGRITDQIISAIERADVVIADITDANPNVLFELGYADALEKRIIVLNQRLRTHHSISRTGGRLSIQLALCLRSRRRSPISSPARCE
jgi:nucleoside 2-deoxyribosyltransferase